MNLTLGKLLQSLFIVVMPLVMLALISCSPQKRAIRKIDKAKRLAPELFVSKVDTIRDTIITPLEAFTDTFVLLRYDTIKIDKERLKIQIIRENDTIYVDANCKGDTVYLERQVVDSVIEKPRIEPDGKKFWDYLYGALYIVLGIVGVKFLSDILGKK